MNNAVFEKPQKIFESIGILKLKQQIKEKPIWYQNQIITLQSFTKNLMTTEIKRTQILMNKILHLGLSTLRISKI